MENLTQEYDMELPINMAISELSIKLLEALKTLEPEHFQSTSCIGLRFDEENRFLRNDETLESAHIWDGSILTVFKG